MNLVDKIKQETARIDNKINKLKQELVGLKNQKKGLDKALAQLEPAQAKTVPPEQTEPKK